MQGEKRKRWIEGAAGNQTIRHCPRWALPCVLRECKGSVHSLEAGSKAGAGSAPHTCGLPALPTPPHRCPQLERSSAGPPRSAPDGPGTAAPVSYNLLNLVHRATRLQLEMCRELLVRGWSEKGSLWMENSVLLLPQKPWLLTSTRK